MQHVPIQAPHSFNSTRSPRHISLLGSTGSIGSQALEIVAANPEQFKVVCLSAKHNIQALRQQIETFQPEAVCIANEGDRKALLSGLKAPIPDVFVGNEGLSTLSRWESADDVLIGLTGFVGVEPTLEALKAGKRVLSANKETFVAAGHLIRPYLQQIIPFDSEHSALFQCLQANRISQVETLYLSASGGPFRKWSEEAIAQATPEQALKHPTWTMGAKVTIDSASLMNKGLEVIEAQQLFGVCLDTIEVVIHPQSILHSAVAYQDGSILAQLGSADMRIPIQYAMTYPERRPSDWKKLSLTELSNLEFEPPDENRFPCLRLAREAAQQGPLSCIALNAADELLVPAFLDGALPFNGIPKGVEAMLAAVEEEASLQNQVIDTLEAVQAVDKWARESCALWIQKQSHKLAGTSAR